ncbi:MAG TPA: HAMP domain-containing sensor histidine kinase [Blastococcus sp.]|jgi:signal transduction histidine kinase|nr:HAMP domain-containing sensor histidine kinase [Blastococcus sp.]
MPLFGRRAAPTRLGLRFGVRFRATVAAVAVVAVALGLSAVVLEVLVGRTVGESVTAEVATQADEVGGELDRGVTGLRLGRAEDGVRVQVVKGTTVLAASRTLEGRPPLSAARPGPGETVVQTIDGARIGSPGVSYRVVVLGTDSGGGADRIIALQSLTVARNAQDLVVKLAAIGIPVLLLVVGAATWLSVSRALHPVEGIRARTAEISAADLSARVPVPASRDEVSALARTMNDMLGRLEAAVYVQRAFVSDAGHEMRSPLAAIRTEVEVAQRAGLSERTLDDLLSETGRLERLVADLLLLARADEGAMALHRVDVDLDDLLEDERQRLRNRPGLTVTAAIGPARVVGDRSALARVIRNLIENAARHASGRVHLASGTADGWAWFEVTDDGPGVPEADRSRVFDRFVRLDDARSREEGGSGLGLAIVRELVRASGGRVALDDAGPLPGAHVRVELPAQPPSGEKR